LHPSDEAGLTFIVVLEDAVGIAHAGPRIRETIGGRQVVYKMVTFRGPDALDADSDVVIANVRDQVMGLVDVRL
jgi:hypothetical protein